LRSKRSAARGVWLLASLLAHAATASAATQPGVLGAAASAANYYQVTCSNDGSGAPASLVVSVRDASPIAAAQVSVQIQKGSVATSSTDAVDGDASFSPSVWVNGDAGVYAVYVDKTEAGEESFTLAFQCMTGDDGTGVPTGTSIFPSAAEVPALPGVAHVVLAAALIAGATRRMRRS
jgi:hypothetical protein